MTISLIPFLNITLKERQETRHWRNQPNVARFFKIQYIDEQTHSNWLKSLEQPNPRNIAFTINANGNNIGVTYFHSIDYIKKEADWGIYIHKNDYRGKGIGKYALSECINFAHNKLNFSLLYLDVLEDNNKALELYKKFGFVIIGRTDNFLRCQLNLNNSINSM